MSFNLDSAIRKVPDFPKKGILFYDITSILTDAEAFTYCIDKLLEMYEPGEYDAVAAIEARGFIFASPIAYSRKIPLILIRKKGKLPGAVVTKSFALEYGEDTIEIHSEDIQAVKKVLIVDDLIATGGTLRAAVDLIQSRGPAVTGIASVVGLPFLKYEDVLKDVPVKTLINYDSEHAE